MDYPDKVLRGISGKFIGLDGILDGEAFQLDDAREDGFCEISVTWYDEPKAFEVLMLQKKETTQEIQFIYGAAEINRHDLDNYMKPHVLAGQFSYERSPTPDNIYHGNFLVLDSLDKGKKKFIKNKLAMLGNPVIHPNPFVQENKEKGD